MAAGENTEPGIAVSGEVDRIGGLEEQGVLLYYKFVQIVEPETTKTWLFDLSSSLGLLGRIRVALDGINVTVGGKMKALNEHIQLVGANPLFEGTDFKLACGVGNVNHKVAAETGFTSLSARIVKELVTLGLPSSVEPPSLTMAGQHVTAQEFHKILQDSTMLSEAKSRNNSPMNGRSGISLVNGADSPVSWSTGTVSPGPGTTGDVSAATQSKELRGTPFPKKTVVVDARNIYETRIGKFRPPKGVELMDPMVRQYSDLPRWIDDHEDQFRNSRILMYCTGGVRCEMASAYIRSKGTGFEDVSQLSGGIQRYLDAFSDGGYFSGKNFVFDHRLAVPSSNQEVVGSCLLCSSPFDDYSSRCRCSLCRMLVLVCNACQVTAGRQHGGPNYVCELCREEKRTSTTSRLVDSLHCEGRIVSHEPGAPLSESRDEVRQRKLKILCLHGFRQSASSLKGRLNALRKKLREHVEFVYVDAPHKVLCQHQLETSVKEETTSDGQSNDEDPSPPHFFVDGTTERVAKNLSEKFAWLVSPATVAGDAATGSPRSLAENTVLAARCHHRGTQPDSAAILASESMTLKPISVTQYDDYDGKLRIAARASSEDVKENANATRGHPSGRAAGLVHSARIPQSMQYRTQTDGWSRSWLHLQRVFIEQGPFDGVLGFSQGAAIAAVLCTRRGTIISQHDEAVSFSFAILCSGFVSPAEEHQQLISTATIECPSLHVFGGSSGHDRQIGVHDSEELASLFQPDSSRTIVRHSMGHIIPTQPEYVQQYLEFLSQFKS